jgi:hypothetical protein
MRLVWSGFEIGNGSGLVTERRRLQGLLPWQASGDFSLGGLRPTAR